MGATEQVQQKEKITTREYVYRVSAGVSNAVLVMLGIGLLCETLANFVGWTAFHQIGTIAKILLAPAFGAAVAYQLKSNTLVLFSAMVASTVGSNSIFFINNTVPATTATSHAVVQPIGSGIITTGQPISAVLAALVAVLIGNWLTGKTPLDMVLVPFISVAIGGIVGLGLASVTTPALLAISKFMATSITISPLLGSSVIALAWSVLLMTPASSAALAIALTLDPVSSAAALIGCTSQFVGFTVMSWRENKIGANLAQGLITPKVQFANLTLHPQLVIPPFVAAIICAPIATVGFGFKTSYELAGIGLNSLIAPLNILSKSTSDFFVYLLIGVVLPAIISYVGFTIMQKMGKAQKGWLTIELQ